MMALKALYAVSMISNSTRDQAFGLPGGSQENTAKDNDNDHCQDKRIQGKLECRVDLGEKPRCRKSTITGAVRIVSCSSYQTKTYRAKAKIIRLLVVITLRMARIRHTRGSLEIC